MEPAFCGPGLRKHHPYHLNTHQSFFTSYNRQIFLLKPVTLGLQKWRRVPAWSLLWDEGSFPFWSLWSLTALMILFLLPLPHLPTQSNRRFKLVQASQCKRWKGGIFCISACPPHNPPRDAVSELMVRAWNASWIHLEDSVQVKIPF